MTTFTETKIAKTRPARGVNVERLLQINLAVLAALATLVLGLAQSDLKLPVMALGAAIGSVIFTDALGWFRLNRFVANVFAVLAAVFSLIAFNKHDGQQLLAIANLLVYLQVILLFQKKDVRIYWQLFVVGLLQVVVAAALNMNLAAGALMVAYMAVGVSALMLFYVYRECDRLAGTAIDSNAAGGQAARMSKVARRRQKKAGLIVSPVVSRRVLMRQLITRRLAVQRWPAKPNAAGAMAAAAAISVSAQTIEALLPPNSPCIGICRRAQISEMASPASIDPVRLTALMFE